MKKILMCVAFFAFSAVAFAQEGTQQPNDDQLQQMPPREAQRETERAAAKEARKKASETRQKQREAKERKKTFMEKHPTPADTVKDMKKEETQTPQ